MTVSALDDRRAILGGSTIAAAAGVDPWCSPVELYYRLRGELPLKDGEPLSWGEMVTPLIFAELERRGFDVWPCLDGYELRDPALPWLVGHPGGFEGDEQTAVVQTKLTGGFGYRRDDALPLNWQAEAQAYMHLAKVERSIVAVLAGGIRLDVHELIYDETAVGMLLARAAAWVECFREGRQPDVDGSDSTREALALRFPRQDPGKVYRLTGHEWELAKALRARREQLRAVEAQLQELENSVKACCPDAETFIDPFDGTFATWKEVTSHRFDASLFKSERPELHAAFIRETRHRRFIVHD